MTEEGSATGSRDDLAMDASRCLRMRYSASNCRRCIAICPQGAITVDNAVAIHPEQCRGCLLCTSVCPAGALEQADDFTACLAKLAKVPQPVLGCVRTSENSNATLACLGGLSEEHLLALYHTLAGRLTLNISRCGECCNQAMVGMLRERLERLADAGLSGDSCCIELVGSLQEIHYRDEPVDRRSFFRSLGSSLFTSAAVMLSGNDQHIECHNDYAGKRVPKRRELLNSSRNKLSHELQECLEAHFDSCVTFDENCTKCQGCVAICPTGALRSEHLELPPVVDRLICTGCGVCEEFCCDGALLLSNRCIAR